jgi:hypothetical protein
VTREDAQKIKSRAILSKQVSRALTGTGFFLGIRPIALIACLIKNDTKPALITAVNERELSFHDLVCHSRQVP